VPADLLIPDSSPFDDQDPWSAWGSATDDFYFVQWGSVLHYDGRNWAEREELGKPVLEVTGSGPNELWLTDMDHVNWHFVNGALEKIPPYIGSYVTELHGGGPGEVWGIRVSAARSQRDTPRELMHYVRGERWTGTGLVGPREKRQGLTVCACSRELARRGLSASGGAGARLWGGGVNGSAMTAPMNASARSNVWQSAVSTSRSIRLPLGSNTPS
jgi:hypothetical protein